jgi:hypothetical protein
MKARPISEVVIFAQTSESHESKKVAALEVSPNLGAGENQ